MSKSFNTVDKSLDEALKHINKLKEDMNHLCKDIDSLYNTRLKKTIDYLNTSKSSTSINSASASNLSFDLNDYTELSNANLREKRDSIISNQYRLTQMLNDKHFLIQTTPTRSFDKCTQTSLNFVAKQKLIKTQINKKINSRKKCCISSRRNNMYIKKFKKNKNNKKIKKSPQIPFDSRSRTISLNSLI